MSEPDQNPEAAAIEGWLRHLRRFGEITDVDEQARLVRMQLNSANLRVGGAPAGWSLGLRGDTSGPRQLTVDAAGDGPPERLIIDAWPGLSLVTVAQIQQRGEPGQRGLACHFEFNVIAVEEPLAFDTHNWAIAGITVRMASIQLKRSLHPRRLEVENGGLRNKVDVPGEFVVESSALVADGTSVAKLETKDEHITLQRVMKEPTRLEVRSWDAPNLKTVTLKDVGLVTPSLPDGLVLELEMSDQGPTIHIGDAHELTVTGRGTIRISGGTAVTFERAEHMTLVSHKGDTVSATTGTVGTIEFEGGHVLADGDDPIKPHTLAGTGGELDGVMLSALGSLADLETLRSLERVNPWTPLRLADSDYAKNEPANLDATGRMVFWANLSDIAAEKKARGSVLSSLRYSAAEARRNAIERGRERWLLSAYRSVGYGESISRPLLFHVVASIGVAVLAHATGMVSTPTPLWLAWKLLISPLAFFRFVNRPNLGSGVGDILEVLVAVEGVLMLFFALAAVRRVTKAE